MRERKKRDAGRKIMKPVWPRLIIWRAKRKGNDRKISRWNFAECNCSLHVDLMVVAVLFIYSVPASVSAEITIIRASLRYPGEDRKARYAPCKNYITQARHPSRHLRLKRGSLRRIRFFRAKCQTPIVIEIDSLRLLPKHATGKGKENTLACRKAVSLKRNFTPNKFTLEKSAPVARCVRGVRYACRTDTFRIH